MADDVPRVFRPNQAVAYNLARARRLRGWTQQQAALNLSVITGAEWSVSTWSNAERSVDGKRVRHFTADDICAFALAFKLPVVWFFLPSRPNDRFTVYEDPEVSEEMNLSRYTMGGAEPFLKHFLDTDNQDYHRRFSELYGGYRRAFSPQDAQKSDAERRLRLIETRLAEARSELGRQQFAQQTAAQVADRLAAEVLRLTDEVEQARNNLSPDAGDSPQESALTRDAHEEMRASEKSD